MDKIKNQAVKELDKLMSGSGFELEDIKQLVSTLMKESPSAINETLSSVMDFSRKDVKAFISDFIDKIETQRRYESEAKRV